jgi:hypothetical protein
MKKAQGLSLTYIILAAIGLILFVVIIAVFVNNSMQASDQISDRADCLCSDQTGKESKLSGSIISKARCLSADPEDGSYIYKNPECEDFIDCSNNQECYILWTDTPKYK